MLPACVCIAACGGPTAPSAPPPPALTCGDPVVIDDRVSATVPVAYGTPTPTGGAAPVSVACTPPSDSQFPLGDTAVTCVATDALNRQASCSFTVSVRHRRLSLTRYLAFGDSITEGETGRPLGLMRVVDTANAYPTFLQAMFSERIPTEPITVENAGHGGERAVDNGIRLRERIAASGAEGLLLLEGINDLNGGVSPQLVMLALRDDIRAARERGVQYVFVSTLLPVAPENCGPPPPICRGGFANNAVVSDTNDRIRAMVPATGGYLVDPYDLFFANRSSYIDIDGLHLRPDGNRALAGAFWDRIVQVIPAQQLSSTAPPR